MTSVAKRWAGSACLVQHTRNRRGQSRAASPRISHPAPKNRLIAFMFRPTHTTYRKLTALATLPAASTLPEALGGRQTALISASLSANTRRAYRHAWDAWLAWLGQEQASDVAASAYLAAMHDAGKAPATCALHAAALRFAHRVGVRDAPVPGPLMERTLAGIRREGRTRGRGQVEGITWSQADATAQVAAQAGLSGLRDAALVATMSDALLRGL